MSNYDKWLMGPASPASQWCSTDGCKTRTNDGDYIGGEFFCSDCSIDIEEMRTDACLSAIAPFGGEGE